MDDAKGHPMSDLDLKRARKWIAAVGERRNAADPVAWEEVSLAREFEAVRVEERERAVEPWRKLERELECYKAAAELFADEGGWPAFWVTSEGPAEFAINMNDVEFGGADMEVIPISEAPAALAAHRAGRLVEWVKERRAQETDR